MCACCHPTMTASHLIKPQQGLCNELSEMQQSVHTCITSCYEELCWSVLSVYIEEASCSRDVCVALGCCRILYVTALAVTWHIKLALCLDLQIIVRNGFSGSWGRSKPSKHSLWQRAQTSFTRRKLVPELQSHHPLFRVPV